MAPTPSHSHDELETLERKHAENPEGRYFVPLANLYRREGRLDDAMRLLREGLAKHPDYLSAHIVLGRCLADAGDAREAGDEFRYVLSLDPQNLIALRTLGELASSAGDADGARHWFGELLDVDPMNEDARRALESLRERETAPPAEAHAAEQPAEDEDAVVEPAAAASPEADSVDAPAAPASSDYDELFGTMVHIQTSDVDDSPFPEEGDAVVTETIAELYTRQGFYDRAADVYRELIRRRGSDARLEESLRRVEALARGDAEPRDAAAHEPAPAEVTLADDSTATGEGPDDAPTRLDGVPTTNSFDVGWGSGAPDPVAEEDEDEGDDAFAASFAGGFPDESAQPTEPAEDQEVPSLVSAPDGFEPWGEVPREEPRPGDEPPATVRTIRAALLEVIRWTPEPGTGRGADVEEDAPSRDGSIVADRDTSPEAEDFGAILGFDTEDFGAAPASEAPADSIADDRADDLDLPTLETTAPAEPEEEEAGWGFGAYLSLDEPADAEPVDASDSALDPSAAGWSYGAPEPAAASVDPEPAEASEPQPGSATSANEIPPADEPALGSDEDAPTRSAVDQAADDEPAARHPVADASPEPDDLFPWEMPAPPASSAASGASADEAPADAGATLPEPESRASESIEPETVETPERAPEAPTTSASDEPTASSYEEEDDDLESFQAWLRSLKR